MRHDGVISSVAGICFRACIWKCTLIFRLDDYLVPEKVILAIFLLFRAEYGTVSWRCFMALFYGAVLWHSFMALFSAGPVVFISHTNFSYKWGLCVWWIGEQQLLSFRVYQSNILCSLLHVGNCLPMMIYVYLFLHCSFCSSIFNSVI